MRLEIDLVPSSCFYSNLRSNLKISQWDKLRREVYKNANRVCEICGGKGRRHPVECHEIWSYDEINYIQKYTGAIALCPDCHLVKHYGLAQIRGKGEFAYKHLMKVNDWDERQTTEHIKESFRIWENRSGHSWKLDISILKSSGIEVPVELDR